MKKSLFTLCALASLRLCVEAQALDRNKLADAIYLAEGGPHARVPYGILSVNVRDAREARAICLRTIDHAWRDYSARHAPTAGFIDFLADRYCPPSDSIGNRHWKHNVKYLYRHQ